MQIKFRTYSDGENTAVVTEDPEKLELLDLTQLTLWEFETAPKKTLLDIRVGDVVQTYDLVVDRNGRPNGQALALVTAIAHASVYLTSATKDGVDMDISVDVLQELPREVLETYHRRAMSGGVDIAKAKKPVILPGEVLSDVVKNDENS